MLDELVIPVGAAPGPLTLRLGVGPGGRVDLSVRRRDGCG